MKNGQGVKEPSASDVYDLGDWAWEFLRRNRDYQTDWRSCVPRHLPHVRLHDGTRLLRLRRRFPRAERWGLFAFGDPQRSAHEAPVYWLPSATRHVVRARCVAPDHAPHIEARRLASFSAERAAVIGVGNTPVVTMKANGVSVALEACGWNVLTHPAAIIFELDAFDDLNVKTECAKLLARLADPTSAASVGRSPFANDERLRHALLALDASLSGATYREIAIKIFGEARVAEDWNAASRFLKDRTRRLVAKGHELMNGGYRDLLR